MSSLTRLAQCAMLLAVSAISAATSGAPGPPALGPADRSQSGDAKTSTRDGVYTRAQADRGAAIYKTRCALCHQPAQFTTPAFLQSWTGQTAHALFSSIRTTMPQENPGGLKRQDYADVLTYLFQINGLPTGDTELKGTDDALKRVVIEPPDAQSSSKGAR